MRTLVSIGFTHLVAGLLLLEATQPAWSAPTGRAWTPTATLNAPGFDYLAAPRLEIDHRGVPTLATLARGPSQHKDALGFLWNGFGWSPTWSLGHGTLSLWPVESPDTTYYLAWSGLEGNTNIFMATVSGTEVVGIDSIASVAVTRNEYAAAVSAKRRWFVISDLNPNLTLRAFYSDAPGEWNEIPAFGLGNNGVTISVLDDTTALVAWAGLSKGIRWGYIRGSEWVLGDDADFLGHRAKRLRLRDHPESGKWLVWASGSNAGVSRFLQGEWGKVDVIRCAYSNASATHTSDSPDLSRDSAVRPVVAWGWQNTQGVLGICVCIPTDDGFPLAEEIADPLGQGVLPSVAVDPNGDVWLAWWSYFGPIRWIHTYVTATVVNLSATGDWNSRMIRWDLSEPAPKSWWAVLRSDDGSGTFEQVARVAAGDELRVNWVDSSPASGPLRYRVRRESVDRNYEWLSDEVVWEEPVVNARFSLSGLHPNPFVGSGTLAFTLPADGPTTLEILDVTGRSMLKHDFGVLVAGTHRFDIGVPLRPGVYLFRLTNAGETSVARAVVVR